MRRARRCASKEPAWYPALIATHVQTLPPFFPSGRFRLKDSHAGSERHGERFGPFREGLGCIKVAIRELKMEIPDYASWRLIQDAQHSTPNNRRLGHSPTRPFALPPFRVPKGDAG